MSSGKRGWLPVTRSIDQQARRARRQDRFATVVLACISVIICIILAAIIIKILSAGWTKLFDVSFLTSKSEQFKAGGGIGPQIFNSFYLLFLTLLISTPLSLGAAIFLAEYAPDNAFIRLVKTAIEVLSSLPSIVVGLFGFLFFVLMFGWGFSIISGACALTLFNIPILVRVIQQALEAVPTEQRDAGLALGLTRWEATVHIILPTAMPAIITGIILSAGRVFGEAAALIYTAGQSAPALDFSNFDLTSLSCPWNIWRPAETLAVHIWKINSEGVIPDLTAVSNGTAAVLIVCILLFNLLARLIGKGLSRKLTAE
jgi:phosphate transport system permease protein